MLRRGLLAAQCVTIEQLEAMSEAQRLAAVQPTEQGQALRQASPFAGVLTHKERFAFFREWAQERQP